MNGDREMDVMTVKQRRRNMQHIHSKDTIPELILRKCLWHKGIHYRKNYTKLPGKPDIAITKYKIAIFVDGDFWHAHKHEQNPGEQIMSNREYWIKKLRRNVERDSEVNNALLNEGWIVMRFWASDIKKDTNACVSKIIEYIY